MYSKKEHSNFMILLPCAVLFSMKYFLSETNIQQHSLRVVFSFISQPFFLSSNLLYMCDVSKYVFTRV